MNFVSVFMAFFAVIGAIDLIFGNRIGLGKEFEKGFMLLGRLALSKIGMIIISPFLGELMQPVLETFYRTFHIDPSVLPAILFANDMGGAPLAVAVAKDETLGMFNGLVVSSMMGCTVSFTIPVLLAMVKPEQKKDVLKGLLFGMSTLPIGCIVAGIMLSIPVNALLLNLLPLIIFSGAVITGLLFAPEISVRALEIVGKIIHVMIMIGLILGMIRFLTGVEVIQGLESYENAAILCVNTATVMSGAFPFMFLLSRALRIPLRRLSENLHINDHAAFGFVSTLSTALPTFASLELMDPKGVVFNAAFAVSAGSTFAGHLAFTLSFNPDYIAPVIAGKLISGICAVILVSLAFRFRK